MDREAHGVWALAIVTCFLIIGLFFGGDIWEEPLDCTPTYHITPANTFLAMIPVGCASVYVMDKEGVYEQTDF